MKSMEIKKNKPIIIAIAGKKYTGKNTFGRFLQKALKEQSIETELVSFAGSIKEVVSLMTGIKNLESYKELQIKELVEYKEYSTPDYLVPLENLSKRDLMIKTAEALSGVFGKESFAKKLLSDNKDNNIIITDLRFKHEYNMLKEKGAFLIKVTRNSLQSTSNHISEVDLDNLEEDAFDFIIENDSSKEDLEDMAINVANYIGKISAEKDFVVKLSPKEKYKVKEAIEAYDKMIYPNTEYENMRGLLTTTLNGLEVLKKHF